MSPAATPSRVHTASHWGVYDAEVQDGQLVAHAICTRSPPFTPGAGHAKRYPS